MHAQKASRAKTPQPKQQRDCATDYADRAYWAGIIKMGLSKFFILRVLYAQPMHGYEVARAVERVTRGCCAPTMTGFRSSASPSPCAWTVWRGCSPGWCWRSARWW